MMVMMVFFMLMHLESFLRMSLVMEHHHLTMRIFVRVPPFHVALFIGNFVAFLWILVIAGSEAELITVRSMDTLRVDQSNRELDIFIH